MRTPWAWPLAVPRARLAGPLRLRRLRPCQPLVERGQPRILGRLRVLPRLVFRHAFLSCAAALGKAAATRAWDMPANEPAKAPLL